ncbi:embigin [Anoplopoma fimbria]|uniref:embigin n=1 Tax=Anoplopoma fimbria TaxID=229290 RepID=UPI0023ED8B5E|nr:embigin [Anoplopoma fimbria]
MSASLKQLLFQILLLLISCRHINTKSPGPTPPPLVPISALPNEERSISLKGESHTEKVQLLNPIKLALGCNWTGNPTKPPNITGFWIKDGDEVKDSRVTVQLEGDQYKLKQEFHIVSEENLGSYSCVFGSETEAKIEFVLAVPQISDVRDKPIVSYLGDYVVITCKMDDTKPIPSTWNWYKANGTDKDQIFDITEPLRYVIKNEERKTKLVVHNLTEADGGLYYCGAVYAIGTAMSHVELKVIGFLEPLKPFMAIVIEVIILVAAILLYERSQSKKNYTPANGTIDQTNTATQGENNEPEESSSMRQRKT